MIKKNIHWLANRPIVNFALLLSYFILTVLPHVTVGKAINKSFSVMSRDTYDLIIVTSAVVVISLVFFTNKKKITSHPHLGICTGTIALTLTGIILSFAMLFVINIEAVHFVQYCLMGFLIFPLTQSYQSTMIIGTIMGAMDELYQYLVLDSAALYYDFNDIVLDQIGIGIALTFLFLYKVDPKPISIKWWQRIDIILVLLIVLSLLFFWISGHFSINPDHENPAVFTLFKRAPQSFWSVLGGPGSRFHILRPIPGLIVITALVFLYGKLDQYRFPKKS